MMRRAVLLATVPLLLACAPAATQAQVMLGRLFSTPAERATMDASRGASATLAPNSTGQQPAPGTPGGPAQVPVNVPAAPEYAGGQPVTPAAAGASAGTPAGTPPGAPGMPPPGMPPGGAAASNTPPPPPALVMSGILRRSDNRTTVWLNDQPQYGVQRSTSQRKGAATPNVTVTLPSGKKVTLKAGQRYDLNEGRIKDINEP
jgi:hypothetical protein